MAQNSSVMSLAGWSPSSARSRHSVLLMSQNRHCGPLVDAENMPFSFGASGSLLAGWLLVKRHFLAGAGDAVGAAFADGVVVGRFACEDVAASVARRLPAL